MDILKGLLSNMSTPIILNLFINNLKHGKGLQCTVVHFLRFTSETYNCLTMFLVPAFQLYFLPTVYFIFERIELFKSCFCWTIYNNIIQEIVLYTWLPFDLLLRKLLKEEFHLILQHFYFFVFHSRQTIALNSSY